MCGARFDVVDEFAHANQLSPRVNVVFQPAKTTTLHAGYARYFTPPPLELVQSQTLNQFVGTSNQPASLQNSAVRSGFANTDELPGYYPLNLGFTQIIQLPEKYGLFKFRFDVTNLFDQSYQIRNGTGIGVFAPQFGPRRGFFGGISWVF
jgi:outer membrane receptor protein involved in Fe transport